WSPPTTPRSRTSRVARTHRAARTGSRRSRTGGRCRRATGRPSTRMGRSGGAYVRPQVSRGPTPSQTVTIDDVVPEPADETAERALAYMDLHPGIAIRDIRTDTVFIGARAPPRIE